MNQELEERGPAISFHRLTGDPETSGSATRYAGVDGQPLPAEVRCAVSIGQ